MTSDEHPVLFFDGECNLCNGLVQFVIRHDRRELFRFAALQSAAGAVALSNIPDSGGQSLQTFILCYKGRYFTRSHAALLTARLLGGGWRLLYAGIIIPPFLRDGIYNFIAKRRYSWFGKRNECMIPTPELKKRFL